MDVYIEVEPVTTFSVLMHDLDHLSYYCVGEGTYRSLTFSNVDIPIKFINLCCDHRSYYIEASLMDYEMVVESQAEILVRDRKNQTCSKFALNTLDYEEVMVKLEDKLGIFLG